MVIGYENINKDYYNNIFTGMLSVLFKINVIFHIVEHFQEKYNEEQIKYKKEKEKE